MYAFFLKFGDAEDMEFDLGSFKREKVSEIVSEDGSAEPFTLSLYFSKCKLN